MKNNENLESPPAPGNLTHHKSLESFSLSLTTASEQPGSSRQSTLEAKRGHQHPQVPISQHRVGEKGDEKCDEDSDLQARNLWDKQQVIN